MVKQIKSLSTVFAVLQLLPITFIGNRDQSMMFAFQDRCKKYVPGDKIARAGKRKVQGDRKTFTHSPHVLLEVKNQKVHIGESLLIIPCTTKDGQPSKHLIADLKAEGLKIGRNDHIGAGGMRIEVSSNGWEQKENLKADVASVSKFPKQLLITDGWTLFEDDEWVQGLLKNKVFPRMWYMLLSFLCLFNVRTLVCFHNRYSTKWFIWCHRNIRSVKTVT